MKNIWNSWLKDTALVYCGLYTLATILNSILFLAKGVYEDPSGNWHELDRAIVVLIVTVAYGLLRYLQMDSFILKTLIVYLSTMALVHLYVFMRGKSAELAASAYRDMFMNYTLGFVAVTVILFIIRRIKH